MAGSRGILYALPVCSNGRPGDRRQVSGRPRGEAVMLQASGQREYDVAQIVGPYAWGILHHIADNFPCGPCAREGGRLLRGLHDLVNAKLGKRLHAPKDFKFLVDQVHNFEGSAEPALSVDHLEAEVTRLARAAGVLASPLRQVQELFEVEEQIEAEREAFNSNPASRLVGLVKRSGSFKGEIVDFTRSQYQSVIGKLPNPSIINKAGKVPWDLALDVIARELGFPDDEALQKSIEKAVGRKRRIEDLQQKRAELLELMPTCSPVDTSLVPCLGFPERDCSQKLVECGESVAVAVRHPSQWTVHDGLVPTEENLVEVVQRAREATKLVKNVGRTTAEAELSSGFPTTCAGAVPTLQACGRHA